MRIGRGKKDVEAFVDQLKSEGQGTERIQCYCYLR